MIENPRLRTDMHLVFDERRYWSHKAEPYGEPVPSFETRERLMVEAIRRAGGELGLRNGSVIDAMDEVVEEYFQLRFRDKECAELPDA